MGGTIGGIVGGSLALSQAKSDIQNTDANNADSIRMIVSPGFVYTSLFIVV
jgi:hypothetical protein